jgi:hypothetical protein
MKGFFAILVAGIWLVGCGRPSVEPAGSASAQPAASSDAAILQAVATLSPYAHQVEEKTENEFLVTTYNLKGLTMDEAVKKIEPDLTRAGFKNHGRAPYTIIDVFAAPDKGGMISITDPDPVRVPDAFKMTTIRRVASTGRASG